MNCVIIMEKLKILNKDMIYKNWDIIYDEIMLNYCGVDDDVDGVDGVDGVVIVGILKSINNGYYTL